MGLFKSFTEGQDFRESMDQFVVLQHALLVLLGSVLASSGFNEPTGVPWFITGVAALRTFISSFSRPCHSKRVDQLQ